MQSLLAVVQGRVTPLEALQADGSIGALVFLEGNVESTAGISLFSLLKSFSPMGQAGSVSRVNLGGRGGAWGGEKEPGLSGSELTDIPCAQGLGSQRAAWMAVGHGAVPIPLGGYGGGTAGFSCSQQCVG